MCFLYYRQKTNVLLYDCYEFIKNLVIIIVFFLKNITNLQIVFCFCCRLSIFEPKIEKVVNGDYVNLTGVSAMDYEGSVRLSCKNISKSMYDKDKVDAEMMKYFLQKFPRFTNPYLV